MLIKSQSFLYMLLRIKKKKNWILVFLRRSLDGDAFAGLGRTTYLSLADNEVSAIPKHVLLHLPLLRTFDIGRNRVMRVEADDFKVRHFNFLISGLLDSLVPIGLFYYASFSHSFSSPMSLYNISNQYDGLWNKVLSLHLWISLFTDSITYVW